VPRQSTGEVCYRDNLLFIVGIPRSGTTWLLSILEHHPDCLAVTPAMLDISVQHPTKETGLFVRGFSDAQILEKVSQMPEDKLLVEKTPSHLLELDRIRTLFPRSKIVLIRRDRLDVIYSMLQANSFWKESPKKLSEAVALYRKFADAQAAFTDYDYVIEYEELVEDPVGEADRLFEHLNLGRDLTSSIVEETKRGRSLPAELKGVFRKGTPGEGLRDFAPEQISYIRNQLGDVCECATPRTRRTLKKGDGGMRVLLSNHILLGHTGSELFTYTIADFLRREGHEVVVYSRYVDRTFADFEAIDVPVVRDLKLIEGARFDVAHVHHNINALEIRSRFEKLPIVFLSHGVLPFLEQPPQIDLSIATFLAVSEEVRDNLMSKGVDGECIEIFRNIVDADKFCPTGPIRPQPRTALVLSYRVGVDEECAIRAACERLNIECAFVGGRFGTVGQDLLPRYINEADIVFSLGRGAIECMLCGRIPIIFDYQGGDGMVTPDNITELMKCNFSGRRYRIHYTVDQLVDEICRYRAEHGGTLRSIALQYFGAGRNVSRLVGVYEKAMRCTVKTLDPTRRGLLEAFVNTIENTRKAVSDELAAKFEREQECGSTLEYQLQLKQQVIENAESLMKQNRCADARAILESVVQFDGYSLAALNDLAVLDLLEKRHEEALERIRRVLALDPRNATARQNLEYLRQELNLADRHQVSGEANADGTCSGDAGGRLP